MNDIFNQLYRSNYSNIAIADYVGISVNTLTNLKKKRSNIPDNLKNKLILKRMKQLRKNGRGGKI